MGAGKNKKHQSFSVAPTSGAAVGNGGGSAHQGPLGDAGNLAQGAPPAAKGGTVIKYLPAEHDEDQHGQSGPGAAQLEVPAGTEAGAPPAPSPTSGQGGSSSTPEEPPVPAHEQQGAANLLVDNWADAAFPVPESPSPGEVLGTPVLVGGADLEGSSATLVSYLGPSGPREVLMATVHQDAEPKLLEALAVSETKMVAVEVEKEVTGRLALDVSHQLHERLVTAAKSVNHHLHQGDGVPSHTVDSLAKLGTELAQLGASTQTTADLEMLTTYRSHLDAIKARLEPKWSMPYAQGGKLPFIAEYHTTAMTTVTEYIPAPVPLADDPQSCPTTLRDATRIKPKIVNGETTWDGSERSAAAGKEYVIDLGAGYQGVYRPYAGHKPHTDDYSLRGNLEIIAPPGAGHGRALVERLGRINLVNRPMTRAEGEWAYLARNIEAQDLGAHPVVSQALAVAGGVDEAALDSVFAAHANEAIGMDDAQLSGFAQRLALEAEAASLPTKVKIVRDAVAKATGYGDGAALAGSAGYDPAPRRSGGWLTWERFDIASDPAQLKKACGTVPLHHRLTGSASAAGGVLAILRNGGALASTERRRRMGTAVGLGMSEGSDMKSGGANAVFLRRGHAPGGAALVWDDPTVLLRRSDWYAYGGDHFGSLNPASGHSVSGLTRDPFKVVTFNGNNEIMFRDGIDLLGTEAPSRIVCGSAKARDEVLGFLKDRGVTHLHGRAVQDVVHA